MMIRRLRIIPWIACLLTASCGGTGQDLTSSDFSGMTVDTLQLAATPATFPIPSPASTSTKETVPFESLLDTATPDLPAPETVLPAANASSCTDGLAYMGDLTYPDKVKVLAGQPMEKRWKVRNDGSCDWGPDYRFRWISGTLPTTQVEQALYPAAAGSEAVIAVRLTAPAAAGEYISWWQAVSPSGVPFGDMLSVDLIVTP
jgi:hypothetical protein